MKKMARFSVTILAMVLAFSVVAWVSHSDGQAIVSVQHFLFIT